MNQDRTRTASTALATPHADEQLRRTVADPTTRPRQLIAAGVKRGNSPFTIQAVNA
ncbi:hypothetical protein [Streptomyces sp. NPDC048445]|uniref:hypothetical protein n=1 Tax=Streptomyces sp. NPDC048445 TaxID=3365553 RepID=UPI0037235A43